MHSGTAFVNSPTLASSWRWANKARDGSTDLHLSTLHLSTDMPQPPRADFCLLFSWLLLVAFMSHTVPLSAPDLSFLLKRLPQIQLLGKMKFSKRWEHRAEWKGRKGKNYPPNGLCNYKELMKFKITIIMLVRPEPHISHHEYSFPCYLSKEKKSSENHHVVKGDVLRRGRSISFLFSDFTCIRAATFLRLCDLQYFFLQL